MASMRGAQLTMPGRGRLLSAQNHPQAEAPAPEVAFEFQGHEVLPVMLAGGSLYNWPARQRWLGGCV